MHRLLNFISVCPICAFFLLPSILFRNTFSWNNSPTKKTKTFFIEKSWFFVFVCGTIISWVYTVTLKLPPRVCVWSSAYFFRWNVLSHLHFNSPVIEIYCKGAPRFCTFRLASTKMRRPKCFSSSNLFWSLVNWFSCQLIFSNRKECNIQSLNDHKLLWKQS